VPQFYRLLPYLLQRHSICFTRCCCPLQGETGVAGGRGNEGLQGARGEAGNPGPSGAAGGAVSPDPT